MPEEFQQKIDQLNRQVVQLYQQGRYEQAIQLATQARDQARRHLGEEHPNFATSLNNLAALYYAMGNFAAAEPLYQQALEIRRRALGEEHPNFAQSLNNLAALYAATDRPTDALELMERAAAIYDRMIGQVFSIGSESQRMAYLETVQGNFNGFLSLVSRRLPASPAAVRAALELVLRRKAIGAEALAAQRDAVLGGRYPTLEPKLRELTVLRSQIAQKTLAGPGPEGPETHRGLLDEWKAQKERLEAELARHIPEMNLERKLRAADRQVVAWALPGGGALVEFVRFDVFDFQAVPARGEPRWKPACYLAFVLPAGEPDNVQMIDLGETEPIDRMIATFRASITGEAEGRSGRDVKVLPAEPGRAPGAPEGIRLRAALFDPLSAALGGCRRLLLAPDGDLTRLPFELLPLGNSRLIDRYQLSYLGAGRDVLRFGAASTGQPADPLVAADPDFDLTGEAPTPATVSGPPEQWSRDLGSSPSHFLTSSLPHFLTSPGRRSRDLDPGALHFGRLPGTRVEGERIAGMLGMRPWLEGAVLEAHLKACRSPRILHLATHGFFLEEQKRDPHRGLHDPGGMGWPGSGGLGRLAGLGLENPLLRSGLALAGVNTWLQGSSPPGEAEDGLLTAEDVSGLDLLDTELVVLSACDTGLGEVRTGEGVFGLRRAFVLAGARTLVMSLWKVSDLATAILMERFYDNLLRRGLARDESLREAQFYLREVPLGQIRDGWLSAEMIEQLAAGNKEVRDELQQMAQQPGDYRPFGDPRYWGAFICQGDPSPLPPQG